jgi:hypothetical protein
MFEDMPNQSNLAYSFMSLGLYGIIYSLASHSMWIIATVLFSLQYVVYGVYVHYRGIPSPVSLALGVAETPALGNLFILGVVTGCLSFGGAYTAIPIIQVEAVLKGDWLPERVFLDCIAISNVLPAPLTIFATFVGFQGGLVFGGLGEAFAASIIITVGILAPCFIFTIAGHSLLEKLVRNRVSYLPRLLHLRRLEKMLTLDSFSLISLTDCVQLSSA